MIQEIKQWLQGKGGFAHVMAAVFASLMLAYASVPSFHALVLQLHQSLPGWVQEVVTTGLALYAWYKTQQSDNKPLNLSSKVPLVLLAALLIPFIAGCTNWERSAYQSLAASKAAIDQAQADYESGKLPHSQPVYDAVNKAKAAQTLAVNALVTYEQMKATGASTSALAAVQADVETALAALPTILADIKALYVTKATGIVYHPVITRLSQEAAYGQRI